MLCYCCKRQNGNRRMRVLITGHLGFIGAVMVPLVQKAGHEVTGLDIGLYDGCDFGSPAAPIREIRADLRDVDGSLLKGFDAVIHLAALSNDPLGDLDAQLTYDINHLATVRLASLAREAGETNRSQMIDVVGELGVEVAQGIIGQRCKVDDGVESL